MSHPSSIPNINAETLIDWLQDGDEIALIDVREEGLYGQAHILLAVNIPYSRLELDIPALVPRLDTRLVLVGQDDIHAGRAAARLLALGYTSLHILPSGNNAWLAAGQRLFASVNVPSKAFAEFVEHHFHTPAIESLDLAELQQKHADVVVLDSRTIEEYTRFHVPGAISCPGAELVYQFADLVPSPDTLVVVSCAGRTRGVMGAQSLINAGVPNRVAALLGGTQGWRLAALPVEQGATQVPAPASEPARAIAAQRAAALAKRFAVPQVSFAEFAGWRQQPQRTSYLFDIRSAAEFQAGHLPGAVHVAGGQLIQCLDKSAATRGALIGVTDNDGTRATVVAHWLRQLGWDASVVQAAPDLWQTEPAAQAADRHQTRLQNALLAADIGWTDVATAARHISQGAAALDLGSSASYRRAHPAGAVWANRSSLAKLPDSVLQSGTLLLFGPEGDYDAAALAALDLREQLGPKAAILLVAGGSSAWQAAGQAVESSQQPPDDERLDYLFWLHDRHDGNLQASAAYLEWEADLPKQIGAPENAGFLLL